MRVRKALAFAGFTHKSPRAISYARADRVFNPAPDSYGAELDDEQGFGDDTETPRGRSAVRVDTEVGRGRAISL